MLYLHFFAHPVPGALQYFKPYIYDTESFSPRPSLTITMGEYVTDMLTGMDYYGTLFPRIPVGIQRKVKVQLLRAAEEEARAVRHVRTGEVDSLKVGGKVRKGGQDL